VMRDEESTEVKQRSRAHSDRMHRVLEERARVLSRTVGDDKVLDAVDLVVLEVGPERYGVDMRQVKEVREVGRPTSIPGAPALWAGVVNLRGSLFPILDLRAYLGLTGGGYPERPKVVLIAASGLEVGLLVDGASEMRTVSAGEIEAPAGNQVGSAVQGLTAELLSILDLDAILADSRLDAGIEAAVITGGES
jgi:purine-binding chemotaxis protein CheW